MASFLNSLLEQPYFSENLEIPTSLSGKIGNLEYAAVKLDGRLVFQVAATNNLDINTKDDINILVTERVRIIEKRLKSIVTQSFDPQTLKVISGILNGETVIIVSDNKKLQPVTLLTLTKADAQLYGRPISELSKQASVKVREILIVAWKERQPEYLKIQGIKGAKFLCLLLVITFIVMLWRRLLEWRTESHHKYLTKISTDSSLSLDTKLSSWLIKIQGMLPKKNLGQVGGIFEAIANWFPSPSLEEKKQKLRQNIKSNIWLWYLLTLVLIWIWLVGLAIIFGLFPYTRPLGLWLIYKPRLLFGLWLTLFVINKVADIVFSWLLNIWSEIQILSEKVDTRQKLRLSTLKQSFASIKAALIILIGIFVSLRFLDISIVPILAGAGVVGLTISFGAQTLIQDLVHGTVFLITDSFAVGDWVVIEDVEGRVEEVNLLYSRIRNLKGVLFTVPHHQIKILQNHTKDWSQVDYTVEVSYETDVDRALSVFEQVAKELHDDPNWSQLIVAPPQLFGVEEISHQGIKIRLLLPTQPGEHWMVNRELRRRVKIAFEREGIAIGIPKQSFLVQNSTNLFDISGKEGVGSRKK
ncbi:mechanosensitive ion channel family protein [Dapis sp. BLCC M172]